MIKEHLSYTKLPNSSQSTLTQHSEYLELLIFNYSEIAASRYLASTTAQ